MNHTVPSTSCSLPTNVLGVHPMTRNCHVGDVPGDVPVEGLLYRILCVNVGEVHRNVRVVSVGEGEGTPHTRVFLHLLRGRVVLDHVPEAHHVVNVEVPQRFDLSG